MREILFRGKAVGSLKWVEGFYFREAGNFIKELPSAVSTETHMVYEDTVGQYTGLTDRNGAKIFEGDILKGEQYPFCSDGEYNYFAEVVWFDNSPAFGTYTFKNPKAKVKGISTGDCELFEDFSSEDWEVIGNIHDNRLENFKDEK